MRIHKLTEMTNEEIAEACEDAADLLEGHWVRGSWYTDEEESETGTWAYCIEGGLAAALNLDTITDGDDWTRELLTTCPVYQAVLDTLNDPDDPHYGRGDLPNWNDVEGRTEQEVLDLLRATAKRVLGVEL